MTPWPYPCWIAHRGAGQLAPENTLAAFRLGAQYGYRMFECDAKLSADGVPFLMHDATLDRTTNGAQALGSAASAVGGDHPWAALSQLDAGAWHSRSYAGEPLPTLGNIAHYCIANGFLLNIEIKPTPGVEEKTGQVVGEHAARLWHGQAVLPLFSSFRPEALAGARAYCRQRMLDASAVRAGKDPRARRPEPGPAGHRVLALHTRARAAARRHLRAGRHGVGEPHACPAAGP